MTEDLMKRLRRDLASGLSASIGDTEEAADRIEELEKQINILHEYIKNAKKCIVNGVYTEAYEHLELVVNDD